MCVAAGLLIVAHRGIRRLFTKQAAFLQNAEYNYVFIYGFVGVSALISAVPMLFYKIDAETKSKMRRGNNY